MSNARLPFKHLLSIVIHGKASWRLLIGAVISMAFSQSVILSTIGLMDGFDKTLKQGLKSSIGDVKITSSEGFFRPTSKLEEVLINNDFVYTAKVIQTEGFLITEAGAKGVIVKGVDPVNFKKVTGVDLNLTTNKDIVVGKELALEFGLKKSDEIALTFAKGNKEYKGAAGVESFELADKVTHGVYEKDLRYVYVLKDALEGILNTSDKINVLLASAVAGTLKEEELDKKSDKIEKQLDFMYRVKPYWSEFAGLIKAVQVEKFSLSFILQLIVIVAIFNIAAFIIFITEKKTRNFFLLRSIGLSKKLIKSFWFRVLFIIWLLGSLLSIGMTYLFSFIINNLEIIKGLREIYFLESIDLSLKVSDFALVFFATLVWVFIISIFGILKVSKKSIVSGMRQEFS